ncbi:unnamed protein product, partial [Prorocentrum cordatum]
SFFWRPRQANSNPPISARMSLRRTQSLQDEGSSFTMKGLFLDSSSFLQNAGSTSRMDAFDPLGPSAAGAGRGSAGPRHRQLRGAARHRGGAPGPGRGREERDHKRSRITFALRDNDKCRREACDIRVLLKGVPQKDFVPKLVSHHADLDWTARYVGIIKWFRAETGLPASIRRKDPGYGYIACRETFKLFERDVWAYPAQLQGFKAGDAVSFRVSIDHWYSWPIALDIEPAPSPLQDDASGPACAPAAGALADGGAPAGAPAPGRPYTADEEGESPWQRFAHLDGEGYWWWCSRSGESFIE